MSSSLKNRSLYQNPQLDYPIHNLDLPFADYIIKNQALIAKFQSNPSIIAANTPYELHPSQAQSKYGALLIHGLLDTPFVMKDVGTHLQSQGMLVRSILLPGHGTIPGALLTVHSEEWMQAVLYGVTSLLKEVEQVFLVGFSTGATLSVHHVLQRSDRIAGLIALSPAFRISTPFASLSGWNQSCSLPLPQWFTLRNEIDYTKYCSVPFNAIYQVYRLTETLQPHVLPCPLFVTASFEDKTVSCQATLDYFIQQSNEKNRMLLYQQEPQPFSDQRITVHSSMYPTWDITSFSHIAIPIAPNNPHYGKQGDYPLASHIAEKNHYEYGEATKLSLLFSDTLYRLALRQKQLRRLTFNPDFDRLIQGITEFSLTI